MVEEVIEKVDAPVEKFDVKEAFETEEVAYDVKADFDQPQMSKIPTFEVQTIYNTNTNRQVKTDLTSIAEIDFADNIQQGEESIDNYVGLTKSETNRPSLLQQALIDTPLYITKGVAAGVTSAVQTTYRWGANEVARHIAKKKARESVLFDSKLTKEDISKGFSITPEMNQAIEVKYNSIVEYIRLDSEALRKDQSDFINDVGLSRPEDAGHLWNLAEGGGSLVFAMGSSVLTGSASAAGLLFGGMAKQTSYEEMLEKGVDDEGYLQAVSNVNGVIQAVTESLGIKALDDIMHSGKGMIRIAAGSATEGLQEGVQGLSDEVIMQTLGGREKGVFETLKEVSYGALMGAILGGGAAGISGIGVKAQKELQSMGIKEDMAKVMIDKTILGALSNPQTQKELQNTLIQMNSSLQYPNGDINQAKEQFKKARDKAYKESAEEKASFKTRIEKYKTQDLGLDKEVQEASIIPLQEFAKTQAQQLGVSSVEVLDNVISNIERRDSIQLKDGTFGQDALTEIVKNISNVDFIDSTPTTLNAFHGSDVEFTEFDLDTASKGINKLGEGVYLTASKDIAQTYGENIKEATISLQKPFVVKSDSSPFLEFKKRFGELVTKKDISNKLKEMGYDGIIQEKGDASTVVVFDNVKTKPILFQDKRGQFSTKTKTITLFEKADASTLVHELGHSFLKFLQDFNPQGLDVVTQWAGYDKNISELSQTEYKDTQEKFARGFEAYLREGKAPTSALNSVFANFKQWLTSIYKHVRALNIEITPEIRKFYADMLSTQEAIQEDVINELKDIGLQAEIDQWTQELKDEGFSSEEIGELILNQMDDIELKDVKTEEDKNVLRNRIQLGLDLAKSRPLTKVMDGKNIYEEASENALSTTNYKDILKTKGIEQGRTKSALAKIMEPISTTLKKISPKLAQNLRSADMESKLRINNFTEGVSSFMDKMFNISNQKDYAVLDLALKNGDMEVITPILEKYDMVAEHKQMRATLDNMGEQLIAAGVPLGKLENWFPRRVKNSKAYLAYLRSTSDWRVLEKYLNDKDMANSPEEEQAQAINDFLVQKSLVTPRKAKKVGVDEVSTSTKGRTIATINDEMNLFYDDALSGLLSTISSMNNAITLNKFFGTSGATKETIGDIVNQLSEEGVVRAKDKDLIVDSLQAYFAGSSVPRWVRVWKNLTYLTGLTKFTSTLTQIKDLYVSSYRNGLFNTLGTTFSKKEVSSIDIGITDSMEEMADIQQAISRRDTTWDKVDKRIQKYLGKGLNLVGFTKMDMLGKNTFIQANLTKMRTEATKTPSKLLERLNTMFSQEEADQIMSDLKNKVNSSSVKKLLFYNISESMPISRAEMPTGYLNSSMGRLFYTFKTYSMKQMNIIYDDVIYKAANGDRKAKVEAAVNLAKLSMLYAAFGVPVDMLKDMLMGRGEDDTVNDYIFENLLQMFGLSRWTLKKAKNEGVYKAIAESLFIPATPAILDIIKDVHKTATKDDYSVNDWRAINSIPAVGNLYYWWFGGGSDKK